MLEVRACSSTIDASLPGAQKRPDQIGDHVGLLVESEVGGRRRGPASSMCTSASS